MKTLLPVAGLIFGLAIQLAAGPTVVIKTEPDQKLLLAGSHPEVVIKIDLTAAPNHKLRRTPLNLAAVLDRSGSMAGAKIEKARQAAMLLVDQLAPGDIFSLVAFDTTVETLVPAGPIEDKEWIKAQIGRIQPRNGTAIYAGVDRGAREIRRNFSPKKINRVILMSDGLANVGPKTPGELRQLGRMLAADGISVSTIGVGDDYNEDLMSGLAEASDANYYYVKDTEKLPEIFARELGSLLTVAAREIRIEVYCQDHVKPIGFIGRPEQFSNQRAVVRLDNLAAGQNRFLLLRCRLDGSDSASERTVATVKVDYTDELAEGSEKSENQTVRVGFTKDERIARGSINALVSAQRELMLNAVYKDEAIAEADAGRLQAASKRLASQAAKLALSCADAPAELRPQFEQEVQNLRQRSTELGQGQYGSSTRKYLQSESWNTRNSKQ